MIAPGHESPDQVQDKLYTTSSLRLADATTLINQQLSVRHYGKNFLLRAYRAKGWSFVARQINAFRYGESPTPNQYGPASR